VAVPETYHEVDFPHGLRCASCGVLFIEGQPIGEWPQGMGHIGDEPMMSSILVCVDCELRGENSGE
jgi:hypothetical protein